MSTRRTAGPLVALLLAVSACGSTSHAGAAPSSAPSPAASSPTTKVLVVIEENHSYDQMRTGMPFLAQLSDTYGYATHWTALTHPSAPNYLGIAGGSMFGVTDDAAPAADEQKVGSATTVFDQALAAGKTAKTYAESMPKNCHVYDYPDRSVGTPKYAVRHNPWVYFPQSRASCLANDVDLTTFAGDAAQNALPNVGFLIPNLDHDAHDGSLATADAWLKEQLTPVLSSSDFTSGRLVVIVTADEDDKHSDDTVLTSVLSTRLSHKVVSTPLTHYSLTRYLDRVIGAAPLNEASQAPDLAAAFGL